MVCECVLDIHLKGLWSSRAQIVVFPGEQRHTERCVYTLIKEPSEPLESIQQGAHSARPGCQGTEPCPQAPRVGTYAKRAQGTHQKELIPILQWALVAVFDRVGVSVTACRVPSAEEFRHS